ncbi:DUF2147 domain-containing protein [Francisella adeliensis]|uniref:DUF2147 domain-containing protein n=1 Tax=Francisella adeliensis TaxID=2007306 RepID=A0A2Z4XY87_9GAMM|nr:DUF2147 domain-containing protein [Francisella adeliensis]AXA33710.1 hypothetical protein CDH04_04475 [Francisella adeliensis]MBK2085606.1 DUF2147 domain-containing protein [Francisella adeliensis]MBK2097484.1 DUF2147 domain-containing protein [Francisella adeliensis]QIW11944.1 DUF2147 domain-containing protein [Francisella adeliensis]QIW13820.1 DUF2147 domain-containing protein [Francisella adeliensis]
MLRKILLVLLPICATISFAAEKDALPNGYWLQKDKDTNTNTSVIQAYNNKDGNLNAKIFVPLSNVDDNKVHAPMIYCKNCGKGSAYGNDYDYSSGKDKYQGMEFVWNAKNSDDNTKGTKGPLYKDGAVLNPHDGNYYHMKAQTIDSGQRVYVRAFWGFLGKDEYWERITPKEAKKIQKLCGLTKDNVYPYENKNGEVVNQKLFEECSTRDFVKKPL